ncbi:MAG: hypothetical protein U5K74_13140 [Gemmatimonadaceae bacterium]|nr:hypothetical protein [Gemmatimonadaceae bacterium]
MNEPISSSSSRGATMAGRWRLVIFVMPLPSVPQPLIDQLAVGGRLLCPVGDRTKQEVVLVRRDISGVRTTVVTDARFVPLVGTHGWVEGPSA